MLHLNNDMYTLILSEIEKSSSGVFLIKTDLDNSLIDFYNEYSKLNISIYSYYKNCLNSDYLEPYAPIFSIIKSLVTSKGELSSLLNEINVYPAHKNLFIDYIFDGQVTRSEDVLPFDFEYEKSRLYLSFANILNHLGSRRRILIFLDNLNLSTISTIDWIKWFIKNIENPNFKILSTITSYNYYIDTFQNEFDELIEALQNDELILETSKNINSSISSNPITEYLSNNIVNIGDIHYLFLALNEALNCYNSEYEKIKSFPFESNYLKLCSLLCKLGDVHTLLEDFDIAHDYYNILLNMSYDKNDSYVKTLVIQKLSMLNILKGKYTIAESLAKQSYKLASLTNNEVLLLQAYTLIFWINEKAKYRTTMDKYDFKDNFIRLSNKYKKLNMLAYFLTHSFNAISYASADDNKITYYNEGHKLATELDNQNCILSAHLKTALVYAVRGYYNISIKYYEKVEKLLIEMKDYFRLAQTYNGMGYYYFTHEQYSNANIYYDKSLQNLRHNLNFDEICMTFVNKGLNSLLACNYEAAESSFNIFLSLVNVLKIDRLRLSTLSRIYGIIGLNNFYLGNFYKAYSFLYKMNTNKPITKSKFTEDDDEFFLFNLLRGLLLKYENNYSEALRYFEKANEHLLRIEGSLKCLYPKFTLEYCSVLEGVNNFYKADILKKNALSFCIDNNYNFHIQLIEGCIPEHLSLDKNLSHFTWVVEAAKQQTSIDALNTKVDEINFINMFQETLSSFDDLNKVIDNSLKLIENKFNIDLSIMFSHTESCNNLLYLSRSISNNNTFHRIRGATSKMTNSFILNDNAGNEDFKKLVEDYLNCEVNSLIYIPIVKDNILHFSYICVTKASADILNNDITLTTENLRIIQIAIKQLFETLQRILGQEKLLQSAYTDVLTGLCNRQGYYKKIYNIIQNSNEHTNKSKSAFLFYIDLDNFKYYNDSFGHKIGDEVLKWYASILNSVISDKDLSIRYGGDEFLLLIQDPSKDNAIKIANNIYQELNENNGFISKISSILKSEVVIPLEKLLSCSIGIIEINFDNNINLTDIMDKADKAMYYAKNNGKHCYIIHQ